MLASSATAAPALPSCSYQVVAFDGSTGSAEIAPTNGPSCAPDVYSLVSYKGANGVTTGGPTVANPQTRQDIDTQSITMDTVLRVTVSCNAQIDLITGSDAPATLTGDYFSAHGTLVSYFNGTTKCVTPTPVKTTPVVKPPTVVHKTSTPVASPTPSSVPAVVLGPKVVTDQVGSAAKSENIDLVAKSLILILLLGGLGLAVFLKRGSSN